MSETRFLNSAIELECPSCNTDDPADLRNGCENDWHTEAGELLADPPAKGDRFTWNGCLITVLRVARDETWADIHCKTFVGAGWTKRQPLPLPDEAVRMPADKPEEG